MPSINRNILAPSILAGDHASLASSARTVEEDGLAWIHLDIMDGHFVPNLSFGPQSVADLRRTSRLFFDTHLMLDQPDRYVDAFAEAGSDLISIHVEPNYEIRATLERIRKMGCRNGIVLNPNTPADVVQPLLDHVDLVLLMTVQPGFGGQSFREDVLRKIALVHQWRRERDLQFRIEVDGGVNSGTATLCRERGCDTFVAGTAYFKAKDRREFASAIEGTIS